MLSLSFCPVTTEDLITLDPVVETVCDFVDEGIHLVIVLGSTSMVLVLALVRVLQDLICCGL